ncbi:MAG: YgjV family protein [Clostridia bacterium]|nr:YgjV family protein [Clostridia bacterium]
MGIIESFTEVFSTPQGIVGQCFGFVGLIIMVLSFQFKKNRTLFIMQSIAAFCFVLNFLLIGAWAGTFFNLCVLIRGVLFMKNSNKKWKLIFTEAIFVGSYAFSLVLDHRPVQILLVSLVLIGLLSSTFFMWQGATKKIRYCQIFCTSPVWIAHNFYNPSLPGIVCECFNMVSSIIFLIRSKKNA